MTFSRADRPQTQAGRAQTAFGWRSAAPANGIALQQWAVAGIVSFVLGVATLTAPALPSQWAPLFLVAVLCPFVAMIVGNVRKLLLGLMILDIPLQLDINLGYRTDAATLGALGGFNLSATTVALIILYALWLGELLIKSERRPRSLLRRALPLSLYLAFVALSITVARDVRLASFQLFMFVQMFLLYVYIVGTVRTQTDVLFIITMLLSSVVLQSLIMIAVYFVGTGFSFGTISTSIDVAYGSRAGGTFKSPNSVASYLALLLPVAMGILVTGVGPWYKRLAALTFSLGVLALLLTQSRGAWIAFGLSLGMVCVFAWRRGWISPKVPLAFLLVIVLLAALFQDVLAARLLGDDRGSARGRIPLMQLAIRVIRDNPLLGVGANNFAVTIRQYATPEFSKEWLYVVHNEYLLVWAETGIGGLVTLMAFLLATITQGWRGWMVCDRILAPLALGLTAALFGHLVHMAVDLFNIRPLVQLLWLLCGLITAIYGIGRQAKGL